MKEKKKKDTVESLIDEIKKTETDFIPSEKYLLKEELKYRKNLKERIHALRGLVGGDRGGILVECPLCGKRQVTSSVKTKKCINCGHSFTIFSVRRSKGKPLWKNNACVDERINNPAWRHTLFRLLSMELEGREFGVV